MGVPHAPPLELPEPWPSSHVTVIVSVAPGHVVPFGRGPLDTVSVTGTAPACVHSNWVCAEVGAPSLPNGADQESVSDLGSGPVAAAVRVTSVPTKASLGVAVSDVMIGQFT
jgi:hypothetical protein